MAGRYEYRAVKVGPVEDWTENCVMCGLDVPWGMLDRDNVCLECRMLQPVGWK